MQWGMEKNNEKIGETEPKVDKGGFYLFMYEKVM